MMMKDQVLQWIDDAEESFDGMVSMGALLPVMTDAGLYVDFDGVVYLFDLSNHIAVEMDSDDEFFEALRDQVNNASRGQVRYYVDWIHCYTQR